MFGKKKRNLLGMLAILTIMSVLAVGCSSGDAGSESATETTSTQAGTESSTETSGETSTAAESNGTIMWLSNLSSGVQYETVVNYMNKLCGELGYEFKVVYGDMFNDPAGNLSAVKNNMSDDVVGLIASQDGGLKDIMAEYPELYVVGYNADMRSVFNAGGTNEALAENDHFLGTIADGFADGADLGLLMAQQVIEGGYKTVSVIKFPGYAYPNLDEADAGFTEAIEAYNSTAADADKITIVGETKVLEFSPLEETYFFETGYNELDAIIGLCAGVDFVYPTMKTAIANGSANVNMKLLTGGFNENETIVADIGGEGVIQLLQISPSENVAWSLIMLDNALVGGMYSDFSDSEAIDSVPYLIGSSEDINNVMTKSMTGTADVSLAQLSDADIESVLTRFNEGATYSDLKILFSSKQLATEALK